MKLKYTTMNLCGVDPGSVSAPAPPFEFDDGSPFMKKVLRIVDNCLHRPETGVAMAPFIFDAEHLHPLMSRAVVRLFKAEEDGYSKLHDIMTSPLVSGLLLADRFEQPIGIGSCNGLPEVGVNGVMCAFEISSVFVELLGRARSKYAELESKKKKELTPILLSIGCDTTNPEAIYEALATAQTLYSACQIQMLCNGGIGIDEIRTEYNERIKPNPKGVQTLLSILRAKIQENDIVCFNECTEGMVEYIQEFTERTQDRLLFHQPLEGQDTVLVFNSSTLQLSDETPPPLDLFRQTMTAVKQVEELQTKRRLKDIPTKANFLLEFIMLQEPGIMQRHLCGAEPTPQTRAGKIWVSAVHLSSNGDHVGLVPTTYDILRRHKPADVSDVFIMGDFNNTRATHQRFAGDVDTLGLCFAPPLTGGPDGNGFFSSIKNRGLTVQYLKAAKPVKKTCDGVLCESLIDEWSVFGTEVVASSDTEATKFTCLPTRDYISDHYGVTVAATILC